MHSHRIHFRLEGKIILMCSRRIKKCVEMLIITLMTKHLIIPGFCLSKCSCSYLMVICTRAGQVFISTKSCVTSNQARPGITTSIICVTSPLSSSCLRRSTTVVALSSMAHQLIRSICISVTVPPLCYHSFGLTDIVPPA